MNSLRGIRSNPFLAPYAYQAEFSHLRYEKVTLPMTGIESLHEAPVYSDRMQWHFQVAEVGLSERLHHEL